MMLMQLMQKQKLQDNMIIWQLDPKEIIDEIEHYLRGEKLVSNPDTKKREWVAWGNPLMAEEGIKTIISLLRARLNKVLVLSNLPDDQVRRIALEVRWDIIDLLFMMYKEWQIRKEYLSAIVKFIDHEVYALLRRAFEDGERNKIYTTQQYVKHEVSDTRDKENKGFFGFLKQ
jgi:hypothetical protein